MEDEYELASWIGAPGAGGPVPAPRFYEPWKLPQPAQPATGAGHPVDPSGKWRPLTEKWGNFKPEFGNFSKRAYPNPNAKPPKYLDMYRSIHLPEEVKHAAWKDYLSRGGASGIGKDALGHPQAKHILSRVATPGEQLLRGARILPGDYASPYRDYAQSYQEGRSTLRADHWQANSAAGSKIPGTKGGHPYMAGRLLHKRIPIEDLYYNTETFDKQTRPGAMYDREGMGEHRRMGRPMPSELRYVTGDTPASVFKETARAGEIKGDFPGKGREGSLKSVVYPEVGKPSLKVPTPRAMGPMLKGGGLNLGLMLGLPDLKRDYHQLQKEEIYGKEVADWMAGNI